MNFSILVAEDDISYRNYFSNVLSQANLHAVVCGNGQEALQVFSQNPVRYRIILVDLLMPIMDGFELIKRIRNGFKDVYPYIFVITSLESEDDVLRAFDLGADEVLLKPISPRKLVTAVLSGMQKLKMITFDVLVKSLTTLMSLRDRYSGNHNKNVRLLSVLLARACAEKMDLDDKLIEDIGIGALLHDVGKILIPESILQKPAPLTKQEYETVKEHTIKGSQILHDSINLHPENDTLMTIYEVIRHHHENYDGTGYPDGLSGLQIPLSARIVKVADVFDALTSDRYYRKAYSPQEALQMMKINMQNHFDPMIFEMFVEHYKFFFSFASGKRQ